MDFCYAAALSPNGVGGFVVTFPDVPEAITEGETRAEALANAADALAVALLGRIKDGAPLPEAGDHDAGLVPVTVAADLAAKIAVIDVWRRSGLTKTELGRRIGKAEGEVRRILDPEKHTKLATLEMVLAAMGYRMAITLEAAE